MNEPRQRTTRSFAGPLAAVLGAMVLVYLASPYISLWRFTQAIKANDRAAIESYVDFPSVRRSLKDELHGRIPKSPNERKEKDPFSGLAARLAPTLVDQLVDAFVTPDGLSALLTDPALMRRAKAKDPTALADLHAKHAQADSTRVRRAFFTSVNTFAAELNGLKMHFKFAGIRWRLKKVELPPNE